MLGPSHPAEGDTRGLAVIVPCVASELYTRGARSQSDVVGDGDDGDGDGDDVAEGAEARVEANAEANGEKRVGRERANGMETSAYCSTASPRLRGTRESLVQTSKTASARPSERFTPRRDLHTQETCP
jgi:hypothetical protein